MKRLIIPFSFCTTILPSCDKRSESPSTVVMSEMANAGLGDAIQECEDHLAKLNGFNVALREAHPENSKEAGRIYVATLENWFEERLITRAKANSRGGVFEASDHLDIKTLDSLVAFYSEGTAILADKDPSVISDVDSILQKYGFYRRVLQKLESEQAGTGQPATRPESKSEGSDKPQPDAEVRPR